MPDGESNVSDDRISSLDIHEDDRTAGKDRMVQAHVTENNMSSSSRELQGLKAHGRARGKRLE
jgi:hypothetical protein